MIYVTVVMLVVAGVGSSFWVYSRFGLKAGLGPIALVSAVVTALYLTGRLTG